MNTELTQYLIEIRAAQYQQERLREAAAERAARANHRTTAEENYLPAQHSDRPGRSYLLAGLRPRHPAHIGR